VLEQILVWLSAGRGRDRAASRAVPQPHCPFDSPRPGTRTSARGARRGRRRSFQHNHKKAHSEQDTQAVRNGEKKEGTEKRQAQACAFKGQPDCAAQSLWTDSCKRVGSTMSGAPRRRQMGDRHNSAAEANDSARPVRKRCIRPTSQSAGPNKWPGAQPTVGWALFPGPHASRPRRYWRAGHGSWGREYEPSRFLKIPWPRLPVSTAQTVLTVSRKASWLRRLWGGRHETRIPCLRCLSGVSRALCREDAKAQSMVETEPIPRYTY